MSIDVETLLEEAMSVAEGILKITGPASIGGMPTSEVVAGVDGAVRALLDGLKNKNLDSAAIIAQLVALDAGVELDDEAGDAARTAKFKK